MTQKVYLYNLMEEIIKRKGVEDAFQWFGNALIRTKKAKVTYMTKQELSHDIKACKGLLDIIKKGGNVLC